MKGPQCQKSLSECPASTTESPSVTPTTLQDAQARPQEPSATAVGTSAAELGAASTTASVTIREKGEVEAQARRKDKAQQRNRDCPLLWLP